MRERGEFVLTEHMTARPEVTAEQRAQWRKLAEAATPGPYHLRYETPDNMAPYWAVVAPDGSRSRVYSNEPDAKYFSALAPEAFLALLSDLDALQLRCDAAEARVSLAEGAGRSAIERVREMELRVDTALRFREEAEAKLAAFKVSRCTCTTHERDCPLWDHGRDSTY